MSIPHLGLSFYLIESSRELSCGAHEPEAQADALYTYICTYMLRPN
jgi:hypothetical protein